MEYKLKEKKTTKLCTEKIIYNIDDRNITK